MGGDNGHVSIGYVNHCLFGPLKLIICLRLLNVLCFHCFLLVYLFFIDANYCTATGVDRIAKRQLAR